MPMPLLAVAALLALAGASEPQFGFGRTIGGAISDWELGYGTELEAWSHTVTTPAGRTHGAYLDHFWSAGGKGPVGQYIADRQTIRYYIDGEATPSIQFEPAMAAGSGIGYEGPGYYSAGLNGAEPWGPEMSNTMMGHSAQTGGGWHHRFKVPFARSIRCTVELPRDVPANVTSKMFLIFRGVEGDPNPIRVGALTLPPIVGWSLRLRKFQTRVDDVQSGQFVSFVNYSSGTPGADSGGALLLTVFVINPFGGSLEGCFRAYTEKAGPYSEWPGLLLSTGTEDYYDSAYYFSHEQRVFYEEDAGLSHKSPTGRGKLASMFRLHHNDPLYFRGKFEMVWRDGDELVSASAGRKCLVRRNGTAIGGGTVDLTVDAWIYTWEQPY